MRKLKVTTFLTLDGVMQAPGAPEEDSEGKFAHGGWSADYWDDVGGAEMDAFMDKPFDMLLGRKTYDIFAGYWPEHDNEIGSKLNSAKKHVASRTLKNLEWKNSELIKGDVGEAVRNLKAQDGPEMQVHGSGNLIQTLLKEGLVDEFHLMVFPVILGEGKRLFADGAIPVGLKLVDSKVTPKGVVIAAYEPAGDIAYGTVG